MKQIFSQSITEKVTFNKWSISALHIDTRVVGHETVVPKMQYTELPQSGAEVILGEYMLTIPGSYKKEMRLQGLYLGYLFNWPPEKIARGSQQLQSIFLGGCEPRCPPYSNCGPFNLPECDQASFIIDSRSIRNSTSTAESEKGSRKRAELPYCTGGNHPGRWIRTPAKVLESCGTKPFFDEWTAEMKRLQGKRMVFEGFHKIQDRYSKHIQTLNSKTMWSAVTEFKPSSKTNQGTVTRDAYYAELQR